MLKLHRIMIETTFESCLK